MPLRLSNNLTFAFDARSFESRADLHIHFSASLGNGVVDGLERRFFVIEHADLLVDNALQLLEVRDRVFARVTQPV